MSDHTGLTPQDDELTLVYLLVDLANATCARMLAASMKPPALEDVLRSVWKSAHFDISKWHPATEIRDLFQRCGLIPARDLKVFAELLEYLAAPATVEFFESPQAPPRFELTGARPNLPGIVGFEKISETLHFRQIHKRTTFSSSEYLPADSIAQVLGSVRRVPLLTTNELMDPLAAVRTYLMRKRGLSLPEVGHEVQQWILRVSGINDCRSVRNALPLICEAVNTLFFGSIRPSRGDLRQRRGARVGTRLLLHEIAQLIPGELPERSALGIYLFMRLRRILRFRQQVLRSPKSKSLVGAIEEEDHYNAGLSDPIEFQHFQSMHMQEAGNMLRPLEYTFLQAAMFGIQTTIPGLNFVFRGGILPRPHLGRSFVISGNAGLGKTILALQILADIASKGGLAVYFSFEEDYDSILERMVTFDLIDERKFDVVAGTELPPENGRGVLLLYTSDRPETVSIPATIRKIANASQQYPRALAIDSINVMHFEQDSDTHEFRSVVNSLIRAIDDTRFIGLILSESDDDRFQMMPYLVDTVIRLARDVNGDIRLLEIPKGRAQNMHRGPHPFHISEGRGVVIYPSLAAVRDTVRQMVPATLSDRRGIPFPSQLGAELSIPFISEKSSVLFTGGSESGKTLLALQLLTEERVYLSDSKDAKSTQAIQHRELPNNVLVVTFNTPDTKFNQFIRKSPALFNRWRRIGLRPIRWFSPGKHLTGDQILSEIRDYVLRGRRYGLPLQRILFQDVDMAERLLPALQREPLFWPTVLQMLNTEAVTSVFVAGEEQESFSEVLLSEVDYAFDIWAKVPESDERTAVETKGVVSATGDPNTKQDTVALNDWNIEHRVTVSSEPKLIQAQAGRTAQMKFENGLIL